MKLTNNALGALCTGSLILSAMQGITQAEDPSGQTNNDDDAPIVMPPTEMVQGKTLSEWMDIWQEWFWGQRATDHPVFDCAGAQCSDNQEANQQQVWFLMGYFGLEDEGSDFYNVVRNGFCTEEDGGEDVWVGLCEVPAGTFLFLPILNTGCSTIEPDSAYELIYDPENPENNNADACMDSFWDDSFAKISDTYYKRDEETGEVLGPFVSRGLYLDIDDEEVDLGWNEDPMQSEYYVKSKNPFTFNFEDNADNLYGVNCFEGEDAVDCEDMWHVVSGWGVMLKPLSPGEHTVHFGGQSVTGVENPYEEAGFLRFGLDITYVINVV